MSKVVTQNKNFCQKGAKKQSNSLGKKHSYYKNNNISNIFHLPSALHEWNNQNATEVGTTVTRVDTGTVGGMNMTNANATAKPNLLSGVLTYDGVNSVVRKLTTNFRSGDSSGEIISHIKIESGTLIFNFASWDSGSSGNYINQASITSNTYRFIHNTTATRSCRGSTNITSGWFTVTSGCTGSLYYIIISGNNETLTVISAPNDGSVWFNSTTTNDSISSGGRLSSLPAFAHISEKYTCYRPYTSIYDSLIANLEVHNNFI